MEIKGAAFTLFEDLVKHTVIDALKNSDKFKNKARDYIL